MSVAFVADAGRRRAALNAGAIRRARVLAVRRVVNSQRAGSKPRLTAEHDGTDSWLGLRARTPCSRAAWGRTAEPRVIRQVARASARFGPGRGGAGRTPRPPQRQPRTGPRPRMRFSSSSASAHNFSEVAIAVRVRASNSASRVSSSASHSTTEPRVRTSWPLRDVRGTTSWPSYCKWSHRAGPRSWGLCRNSISTNLFLALLHDRRRVDHLRDRADG